MLPPALRAQFLARGCWLENQTRVTRVKSRRRSVPEVEAAIERAWIETNSRPGVTLFDGPVCRLESFEASATQLTLAVSETSYRINVGTNFSHPEFATMFGRDVMANPVGVSAGVISADGFLIVGRRNGSVAYYPHMYHPFAGSLEVRDSINLFDDVRRELREELHLQTSDIESIECIGIVEDQSLVHPETIFRVRSTLPARQIQAQVQADEHGSSLAVPMTPDALRALALREDLTPVGAIVAVRLLEMLGNTGSA